MILEDLAYQSLEIDKIMRQIARASRSDLGLQAFSRILPAMDMQMLEKRQSLFRSIEERRNTKGDFPWDNRISSISPLVEEAKESAMLLGEELLKIRRLLFLSLKLREALMESRSDWPDFSMLLKGLRDFTEEIETLSVIDEGGRLYDSASEKLRRLRQHQHKIQDTIRRRGQRFLSEPGIASALQERVLALRNGRYVVLVRQDALGSFPGLVMDRSGSGSSVYIEPHVLVSANNELVICQQDLLTEERRILYKLTEKMLKRESALLEAEEVLGTLDLYYALSEKTRESNWHLPQLVPNKKLFDFKLARHPLLGEKAVPVTLSCGEKFRILVITGPNTGGKTVALKTAGVCIALGWYGFPIPAEENSRLGMIDALFADIGDEQSIEQSLSTFSAHVTHICNILKSATDSSVVLLDELGAGTDPDEGAALGISILDWLLENKSLVLATTHHNPIKRFALSAGGIETASVQFNTETLSPTYHLVVGIPGRSNALLIAGGLGMPQKILDRARKAMHGGELSMEDLISDLQDKRSALEKENVELDKARKAAEKLRKEYEARTQEFMQKRDKLIADADRKAVHIVQEAEESAKALIKKLGTAAEVAARKELDVKRKHFSRMKKQIETREEAREDQALAQVLKAAPNAKTPKIGDLVSVAGSSIRGTLVRLDEKKAVIQAGVTKMEVPSKRIILDPVGAASQQKSIQVKVAAPIGVSSSMMVRGMTVDEAIPLLEQYLDRAYRAGYGEVTIIHGRGEGILRREVQELCKRTPYVVEQRLGEQGEGGYGVTIVKFQR